MRKIFYTVLLTALLSGCSLYSPTVQQGTILKPAKVSQLKIGMSQFEVRRLLGDPILTDTFQNNQMAYVYTLREHNKNTVKKRLVLTFKKGSLVKIEQ